MFSLPNVVLPTQHTRVGPTPPTPRITDTPGHPPTSHATHSVPSSCELWSQVLPGRRTRRKPTDVRALTRLPTGLNPRRRRPWGGTGRSFRSRCAWALPLSVFSSNLLMRRHAQCAPTAHFRSHSLSDVRHSHAAACSPRSLAPHRRGIPYLPNWWGK